MHSLAFYRHVMKLSGSCFRISNCFLQLPREALMSCGDGANDLQLVANSGIGVAMGNAVPAVRHQIPLSLEALLPKNLPM